MALQECGNGHIYDTDQYAACPYCVNSGNRIDFGAPNVGVSDVGMPNMGMSNMGMPNMGMSNMGMPNMGMPNMGAPNMGAPNMGYPTGAPMYQNSEIGSTVAPQSYRNRQEESSVGKTVGAYQKKMSIDPVVGWLVCIEGPEKGKDYRILGKNNTIGRSESSDICLKGDASISRENHAKIAYDQKHNTFHVIPADGANPVYLNEEPVFVPREIKKDDIIEIGDFKMLFVPFCNDKFVWDNGKKNGTE